MGLQTDVDKSVLRRGGWAVRFVAFAMVLVQTLLLAFAWWAFYGAPPWPHPTLTGIGAFLAAYALLATVNGGMLVLIERILNRDLAAKYRRRLDLQAVALMAVWHSASEADKELLEQLPEWRAWKEDRPLLVENTGKQAE